MQWANYKYIKYVYTIYIINFKFKARNILFTANGLLVSAQAVFQDRVPNKVGGKLIPFIAIKREGKQFLEKNKVCE